MEFLFDWGDTLMAELPGQEGPMCGWTEVRAMPNAREALSELSRLARCHLATNARDSEPEEIRSALRRVALDEFISHVFCYRVVGELKPSPRYFDAVVSELGCDEGSLVMIGDALETDIRGAKACGLRAIWYNPSDRGPDEERPWITDLRQLVEFARSGVLRES